MDTVTKEEFILDKVKFFKIMSQGAIFVHPTDTIYGIGCDARNEFSSQQIRDVKERASVPFSIISPSKKWIYENCDVSPEGEKWLDRLPGPYTLIFRVKNRSCVAAAVSPGGDTLGVRMPKHWFTDIVAELGFPVVTTSANITGEPYMTSIDDLNERIRQNVDFIIYEGEREGRPSTIVKLFEKDVTVVER